MLYFAPFSPFLCHFYPPVDALLVHLPPTVLTLPAVTREIVFSTEQLMTKFAIRQTLFLHSQMVEEWNFEFGFVPPNTTNTWENTITAASDAPMFPAHLLSGNLQILSEFLNEGKVFGRCLQRVYYDAPE